LAHKQEGVGIPVLEPVPRKITAFIRDNEFVFAVDSCGTAVICVVVEGSLKTQRSVPFAQHKHDDIVFGGGDVRPNTSV